MTLFECWFLRVYHLKPSERFSLTSLLKKAGQCPFQVCSITHPISFLGNTHHHLQVLGLFAYLLSVSPLGYELCEIQVHTCLTFTASIPSTQHST